jgi:hypothetical protein
MPDLTARRNTFTQRVRPVPGPFQARSRHIPDKSRSVHNYEYNARREFYFQQHCLLRIRLRIARHVFRGAWVQLAMHVLGCDRFARNKKRFDGGKVIGTFEFLGAIQNL